MVDVFISYSRKDLDAVTQLAKAIEAEGYKVWWDAELPPHKSYGEVITGKIEDAKAAIVVWSPDAADSEWVRAEADMARNQKKLVQTALGNILPPLPFNQIQFADIGNWQGEADHPGWRKVKESLADLCGERDEAAPVAAAPEPEPTPAPPPPPPSPAPETVQPQALAGAPRERDKTSLKVPILAAAGVGVLGVAAVGTAVMVGSGVSDDYEELPPVAVNDPETGGDAAPPPIQEPVVPPPTQQGQEMSAPQPSPTSGPSVRVPSGPQTFSGALRQGQSQSFPVNLGANVSYFISAECDMDCTDIDMWLYDENGNLIDEDVLDDDFPIVEVTPIRSAQFSLRLQMYACSIEPCGFQIVVQPR